MTSDKLLNPPIVWNMTNLFGGYDTLKEVFAKKTRNGKWYVRCTPIIRQEDYSFFKFGQNEFDAEASKEYEGLIEGFCRIESDGGGRFHRKTIIYFPANPVELKDWILNSDFGVLKRLAQEISLKKQRASKVLEQYEMTQSQVQRFLATAGIDEFIMNKMKSHLGKVIDVAASTKKVTEDTVKSSDDKKT